MASFTTFTEEALERYLVMFGKGELKACKPVVGGIENSNYFVTLDSGSGNVEYVLTIIEQFGFDEAPFFNKVMSQLFQYDLPVAAPHSTLDGMSSTIFCGKPAFLLPRLEGSHLVLVNEDHCFKIGEFLGGMHQALTNLKATRANPYHRDWMQSTLNSISNRLKESEITQLGKLIGEHEHIDALELPSGLIHGDLFKDNALFTDRGELSGVIDFYHACHDILIQDIAIAINDWCQTSTGNIDEALRATLIAGYEKIRPLEKEEAQALVPLQRTSAARFALTRFLSGSPPLKPPEEMLQLASSLTV
jgi:homoserine kinase type II